jgi:hypothetical protein
MQQKKNLMPGQAKIEDFDNDDDYYYYQWERENIGT